MGYLYHAYRYVIESGVVTAVGAVFFFGVSARVTFDVWPFFVLILTVGNVLLLFRRVHLLVNESIERSASRNV